MTISELIAVFRACGGTLTLHDDGLGCRVEGDARVWPIAKELIQRDAETLEALRAGEPASANELIGAWKELPQSEREAFGEHALAKFDDLANDSAKRLIKSAASRCPQLADARTLIAAWNEAARELHSEFPDGVLDFEAWGDEAARQLIESASLTDKKKETR